MTGPEFFKCVLILPAMLTRKNHRGFPQIQRSRRFAPAVSAVSLNLRENTLWRRAQGL